MANNVNPPPTLKIPEQFLKDQPTRKFFEQQKTILFQLWKKQNAADAVNCNCNLTFSTTADLEDISSEVNTTNKVFSLLVINETTGSSVFASGHTPADVWVYMDENVAHTPV